MTNAAISSAVRGPCNGLNLKEFLLRKEMVPNPQRVIVTEFRGAPDNAYAPTPGPNPETVTGAELRNDQTPLSPGKVPGAVRPHTAQR